MKIADTRKQYKSTNTMIYSCQYHCIFTTKYRRKVLSDKIQIRLKELIIEKQNEFDVNFAIIRFHKKFIINGYDLNDVDTWLIFTFVLTPGVKAVISPERMAAIFGGMFELIDVTLR